MSKQLRLGRAETITRARLVAARLLAWEAPRDWPDPTMSFEAGELMEKLLKDLEFTVVTLEYERRRNACKDAANEAALAELGRAEAHHVWHHQQEGREVEPDEERLRVLLLIAEALDE